jgi:hypothetical protein
LRRSHDRDFAFGAMLLKKDFGVAQSNIDSKRASKAQDRFQKISYVDSIIAHRRHAADFFNSISQNEPRHSLRRNGSSTSVSGPKLAATSVKIHCLQLGGSDPRHLRPCIARAIT